MTELPSPDDQGSKPIASCLIGTGGRHYDLTFHLDWTRRTAEALRLEYVLLYPHPDPAVAQLKAALKAALKACGAAPGAPSAEPTDAQVEVHTLLTPGERT